MEYFYEPDFDNEHESYVILMSNNRYFLGFTASDAVQTSITLTYGAFFNNFDKLNNVREKLVSKGKTFEIKKVKAI